MRYKNISYEKPQTVSDATIGVRLSVVINNVAITTSDKSFCESLQIGYQKYKSLTVGQYDAFVRCEKRYSPENQATLEAQNASNDDWNKAFDAEKRANLNIAAKYYSTTVYFKDLGTKILANPEWIPSKKQYETICENKYALRVIENTKTKPKYSAGQLVQPRSTEFVCCIIEIIDFADTLSPTAGSREYRVLMFGTALTHKYRERDLKLYRQPKEGNNK